jgi:hypothetical protein
MRDKNIEPLNASDLEVSPASKSGVTATALQDLTAIRTVYGDSIIPLKGLRFPGIEDGLAMRMWTRG